MLILARRVGESVMIGTETVITVLGVKGNQVRIGIAAPRDVPVHREEIYQKVQREQRELTAHLEEQRVAVKREDEYQQDREREEDQAPPIAEPPRVTYRGRRRQSNTVDGSR